MKSHEVRQEFLNFFASKTHKVVPSAPMVIKNDPTLMFTNAGMNPFKEFFLGNAKPTSYSKIRFSLLINVVPQSAEPPGKGISES